MGLAGATIYDKSHESGRNVLLQIAENRLLFFSLDLRFRLTGLVDNHADLVPLL